MYALNAVRGGAPIGNENAQKQPKNNQKTTKKQPNVNVNDNVNVNNKETNNFTDFLTTFYGFLDDIPRRNTLKNRLLGGVFFLIYFYLPYKRK